jgi:acyl-CoA dehydrogenase
MYFPGLQCPDLIHPVNSLRRPDKMNSFFHFVSNNASAPILTKEPDIDDITCGFKAISKQPKGMYGEIKKVIALARRFTDEVVRPQSLEMEQRMLQDPAYLPWEWVEKANELGFYTMWIPKIFGGKGYCFPSLSYFIEEVASVCLGMANLIGVHYLGVATLVSTWNFPAVLRVCRETVNGEKNKIPCIISMAITEPSSGSDTASADLIDMGQVSCHARKESGGYVVNGTKVFISNAPFSTWHVVLAYEDVNRPSDTGAFFAVKKGAKGFSIGRTENKMGQKACPASELIFKDCFIPHDQVCFSPELTRGLARPHRELYQRVFDYLCSASRAGVCSMGAGVARGAYEAALSFANQHKLSGEPMVNLEWVQCRLAEMFKNIAIARLLYVETNYANGLYGLFKMLQAKPVYYLMKWLPVSMILPVSALIIKLRFTQRLMYKIQFDWQPEKSMQRTSGWSAMSKFTGSDIGVQNSHLAMELMGHAGLRHDMRIEKHLRDAKLLQIYEGTNQINRLDLFKNLIGRNCPQLQMHQEKEGIS